MKTLNCGHRTYLRMTAIDELCPPNYNPMVFQVEMGPPKTLDETDFISKRFNLSEYVLIESRDPFEYGDARYLYDMARGLAEKDNVDHPKRID